jgi:hypothetical protein
MQVVQKKYSVKKTPNFIQKIKNFSAIKKKNIIRKFQGLTVLINQKSISYFFAAHRGKIFTTVFLFIIGLLILVNNTQGSLVSDTQSLSFQEKLGNLKDKVNSIYNLEFLKQNPTILKDIEELASLKTGEEPTSRARPLLRKDISLAAKSILWRITEMKKNFEPVENIPINKLYKNLQTIARNSNVYIFSASKTINYYHNILSQLHSAFAWQYGAYDILLIKVNNAAELLGQLILKTHDIYHLQDTNIENIAYFTQDRQTGDNLIQKDTLRAQAQALIGWTNYFIQQGSTIRYNTKVIKQHKDILVNFQRALNHDNLSEDTTEVGKALSDLLKNYKEYYNAQISYPATVTGDKGRIIAMINDIAVDNSGNSQKNSRLSQIYDAYLSPFVRVKIQQNNDPKYNQFIEAMMKIPAGMIEPDKYGIRISLPYDTVADLDYRQNNLQTEELAMPAWFCSCTNFLKSVWQRLKDAT